MSLINTTARNATYRRKFMNSTILCASLVLASTGAFAGAGSERSFSQPEQSAREALRQFAKQTNTNILFSDDVVRNERSPALIGTYDTPHALGALLTGTGLVFEETDDNTYVIRKKQQRSDVTGSRGAQVAQVTSVAYQNQTDNAAPAAVASDAPAGAVKTSNVSEASGELEEILVQAKRRASTATKFELSVIDTPQSIKAVTGDVLEYAGIRDFNDLVKIDASTSTKGKDAGFQSLVFRGFDYNSEEGIKIDGSPMLSVFPSDFFVFDRVEILKGPSSSVYGQNAVGGMVNAVLKRPLSTFGGFVGAQVGSWGYHRVEGDVGGPLTEDGKLSFRAVGAYEKGGDFIDFANNESKLAYGALKYDFDEATSATVIVEYQKRNYMPIRGLALFLDGFKVPDVPASRLYGAPWAQSEGDYVHTEAEITHKFANNWLLKFNGQYGEATNYGSYSGPFGFLNADGDLINVNGTPAYIHSYFRDTHRTQWSGEVSLTGDFDLFGQSHTFSVGVDRRVRKSNQKVINATLGQIDIFNPDYSALNPPRLRPSDFTSFDLTRVSDDDREFWGGSAQLLLHPVDRLSVLLGVRWDKSKITALYDRAQIVGNDVVGLGNPTFNNVLSTTKLVPSVGATFELQPDINLYANYGKSFIPQTGLTYAGNLIEPEEGYQFEAGVKGNFGQMTATLAVFDMTRSHIMGVDVDHPTFSLEIGTQRSKGVEVDVFGNILPGWSVYGSAAYVDAKITASDSIADIGARLANVPKYALSLYSNYQFQSGPLAGLGFGGGVVTKQDRVWGLPHFPFMNGQQFNPGGYTTVDLRLFYEIGNIIFDLKANNVFDERYYNVTAPALRVGTLPGRPREFVGSVKYKF